MAFNAKNLEYNKQEPAFLRKLRGEYGGLDGRHNVQIARPKKDRLKTGDDGEDDPVIVDEEGETVDKAEFERRMKQGEDQQPDGSAADDGEGITNRTTEGEHEGQSTEERQKVTEIGGSSMHAKKRKIGKVVGREGEEGYDQKDPVEIKSTNQKEKADNDSKTSRKNGPAVPKKKGKKIKLSFDEPDG
jgi:hypothetical protein